MDCAHLDDLRATPGEDAALGRLLAWAMDMDFANRNPAGGGFDAYRGNYVVIARPDGQEISIKGLASHSIYFEVLGEHGWIGLGIFLVHLRRCSSST